MSNLTVPLTLTEANFATTVLANPTLTLVDFWAPWCGPCRMVSPIIQELATDFAEQVTVAKLNTDNYPQLATQYNIQAIPTLLFFQNGHVVDQVVGVASKKTLAAKINALLTQENLTSHQAA
ncbi:MAG: thioredoxin [Oculatellaceae cyanobacterium bins.114]|nr:thioredoxin [Oculatellaceae cyanobacterium bins.114]